MHEFLGMKKHVQLKIVQHKVSVMLYSVQAFKIRASLGQSFIIEGSCISNHSVFNKYTISTENHTFIDVQIGIIVQ